MLRVHADLWSYVFLVTVLGAVIGVIGISCIILAGIIPEYVFEKMRLGSAAIWILLGFGIILLVLAYLCVAVVPRWYRRATCALEHGQPIDMDLVLRREDWTDSTEWYAELWNPGATASAVAPQLTVVMHTIAL
jgi:hypothetical protein